MRQPKFNLDCSSTLSTKLDYNSLTNINVEPRLIYTTGNLKAWKMKRVDRSLLRYTRSQVSFDLYFMQ